MDEIQQLDDVLNAVGTLIDAGCREEEIEHYIQVSRILIPSKPIPEKQFQSNRPLDSIDA